MATFLCAYRQKLEDLASEEAKIPALEAELEDLRAAAAGLCQDADAAPYFEAHDRIRELAKQIAALKSGDRLGEIILEALPFIKAIEQDERLTCDAEAGAGEPRRGRDQGSSAAGAASPKTSLGMERFVTVRHKSSAGTIAKGYALGNLLPEQSTDAAEERMAMICSECDASLLVNSREAVLVCVECGRCQPHLEIAACNMSFSDRQAADVLTHFSYRRENHFGEWLAMVQGREGSEVPMDVVTAVRSELAKERLSRNNINPKIIRAALKRLGQSKFFDSSPSICHQLGGPKPPVIGSEAESQLKSMFSAIQKPFATHCPPSRRNFLSYSFVLHKFAQLIERDDLLGAFPLLKSSTKLYVQDQIWRKICSDLDWAFYPSV